MCEDVTVRLVMDWKPEGKTSWERYRSNMEKNLDDCGNGNGYNAGLRKWNDLAMMEKTLRE